MHPITSTRATAVKLKSSTFGSIGARWRPCWQNFQKVFLYFFDLLISSKTLAYLFADPTTNSHATAKTKNAIFQKGSAWISRTVYIYIYIYIYCSFCRGIIFECIYKYGSLRFIITDIWHGMLRLLTHATLYSMCGLVVPNVARKLKFDTHNSLTLPFPEF